MPNNGDKIKRLRDFFIESFTMPELEEFLTLTAGYRDVASVAQGISGEQYFFKVAWALDRRGIDAAFFDNLEKERPRKEVQIRGLRESWLADEKMRPEPAGPATPNSHPNPVDPQPAAPERPKSVTPEPGANTPAAATNPGEGSALTEPVLRMRLDALQENLNRVSDLTSIRSRFKLGAEQYFDALFWDDVQARLQYQVNDRIYEVRGIRDGLDAAEVARRIGATGDDWQKAVARAWTEYVKVRDRVPGDLPGDPRRDRGPVLQGGADSASRRDSMRPSAMPRMT